MSMMYYQMMETTTYHNDSCCLAAFGAEETYVREGSSRQRSYSCEFQHHAAALEEFHHSQEDIDFLVAEWKHMFPPLQHHLQKNRAITNELLKQKLPLFLHMQRRKYGATKRYRDKKNQQGEDKQVFVEAVASFEYKNRLLPTNRDLSEKQLLCYHPAVAETAPTALLLEELAQEACATVQEAAHTLAHEACANVQEAWHTLVDVGTKPLSLLPNPATSLLHLLPSPATNQQHQPQLGGGLSSSSTTASAKAA